MKFSFLVCGHTEQRERLALPRSGSWRVIQFPALVVLFEHPTEGIGLFDTGYAPRVDELFRRGKWRVFGAFTPVQLGPGESAVEQLAARGIDAADVRWIFLSHFHVDHTGGLRDFPKARVYASAPAWEAAQRHAGVRSAHSAELLPPDFAARVETFAPAGTDLFGDGSLVTISLPGHAAGQCGLLIRGAPPTLLVADAVWQRQQLAGEMPHFLTRLIQHDWAAYRETLARLKAFRQEHPDWRILPTHCAASIAAGGAVT